MLMPLGTISQADKDVIKTTTQCFANISTFSALRGPELKIWGPPLLLSAGYDATFVRVHENGDTGGRKRDKEQQKVNEEFVKANPKGCHKKNSIDAPRALCLADELDKIQAAENEQTMTCVRNEFATPKASTGAQGPQPALAMASPIIMHTTEIVFGLNHFSR